MFRNRKSRGSGRSGTTAPVMTAGPDAVPVRGADVDGSGSMAGTASPDGIDQAVPKTHRLPVQTGYVRTVHTVMAINRGLMMSVLGLTVAVVALGFVLLESRKWIPVYVPPDTSQGTFLTAYTPNPGSVYGFGFQTLQFLYHWPKNGSEDYPANIDNLAYYITPKFRSWLLDDFTRLSNRFGINELRGRSRALHPIPAALFEADRVVRISEGVWHVTMDYRLVEEVDGSAIKDTVIRYSLRIVQSDVNPHGNQWGMMLDGFVGEPQRIEGG